MTIRDQLLLMWYSGCQERLSSAQGKHHLNRSHKISSVPSNKWTQTFLLKALGLNMHILIPNRNAWGISHLNSIKWSLQISSKNEQQINIKLAAMWLALGIPFCLDGVCNICLVWSKGICRYVLSIFKNMRQSRILILNFIFSRMHYLWKMPPLEDMVHAPHLKQKLDRC